MSAATLRRGIENPLSRARTDRADDFGEFFVQFITHGGGLPSDGQASELTDSSIGVMSACQRRRPRPGSPADVGRAVKTVGGGECFVDIWLPAHPAKARQMFQLTLPALSC
jgi:hypothetical protein